jgi:S-adenosylhomocysteine hydrolase
MVRYECPNALVVDTSAGSKRAGHLSPLYPLVPRWLQQSHPVIGRIAESAIGRQRPMKGIEVVMVQHARGTVIAEVEQLIAMGAAPANITLLRKDYLYPDLDQVLARLKELGVRVKPLSELKSETARLKKRLRKSGRRLLAIDDGFYWGTEIAADDELSELTIGLVEQTTRGIWNIQKLERPLPFAVLGLPLSHFKKVFECGAVGEIFISAAEWHAGEPLAGRTMAVLGAAGVIGAAVAEAGIAKGIRVRAYDIKPSNPYWELVNFGKMAVCPTKAYAIRDADIVVGATGNSVLQAADLRHLKDGAKLASASSGQYEFALELFGQLADSTEPFRAAPDRAPHGITYCMPWGRSFTVLDGGRPLNLGIAAGPEDPCFDLVIAMILAGATELAAGRFAGRTGIIDCFDDIASRWGLPELFMALHQENA